MNFFYKLVQQIKGGANDALDVVSDESRGVRQTVRDMEEDVTKATNAVADVNAQKTLIQNRLDDAQKAASDWGDRAERALKGGDEDLAKQALERQIAEEDWAVKYQTQLTKLLPQVERLNRLLDQRKSELAQAKIDSDVIQASNTMADATMKAAKSLSSEGASGSLKSAKDAVDKKAARANALLYLNEDKGSSVERKLRALEASGTVSDRMATLKAKVNGGQPVA